MHTVIIDLTIGADEYLKQYQHASAVVATHSRDGRSVRFPANILRPFVTHTGIKGTFKIQFDDAGKFNGIEKVDITR